MAEAPTIYSRSESGLEPADSDKFGLLGDIYAWTIHHSAGPRATTKERAQELNRLYQVQHINQGWGDIGYHFSVDDRGRVYRLRPIQYKGAHTAGTNTGNVGIMFHGNFMTAEPTDLMKDTLEWLFKGGFYALSGVSEYDLKYVRGHREWPDQATACPGDELLASLRYRRDKDFK